MRREEAGNKHSGVSTNDVDGTQEGDPKGSER